MALSDELWYTDDDDINTNESFSQPESVRTKEIVTNIQPPPPPVTNAPPVSTVYRTSTTTITTPSRGGQPTAVIVPQNPQGQVIVNSGGQQMSYPQGDQIPAVVVQSYPKRKTVYYWPFMIYLILSAIVLLGFIFSKRGMGETVTYVLLQIIWIIIIGFIIYWLCKSGKVGWAWFVLFLPLIIQIVWVILAALFPN